MTLDYIEAAPTVETSSPPLLVMLHGYGSDERDLMGLAPMLDGRCHTASVRAPLDLEKGGHSWFPIEVTPDGLSASVADAQRARDQICSLLIVLQQTHDAVGRTLLLGFSQGAGMALYSGFQMPAEVAGLISLSGLCLEEMLPDDDEAVLLSGKQLFMSHGLHDPLIAIEDSRASHQLLQRLPLDIVYREYAMGHEINQECLQDLTAWLRTKVDALVSEAN